MDAAVAANLREKFQNFVGSATGRKRLSDITNTVSSRRVEMMMTGNEGNSKVDSCMSSNDIVAQLMKENTDLLKLLAEKNKIIELSGIELQRLKLELQKSNQQNWQLAQSNSHMLAEINVRKDRLKILQHELCGTSSVLKLKTSQLEEKEKLIKELLEKIGAEANEADCAKVEADETQNANDKKVGNPNKKRKLKDQPLRSTILEHQVTADGQANGRRRSLRVKSSDLKSESCDIEDSFKTDNASSAVSQHVALEGKTEARRRSLRMQYCNLKSESCKSAELPKIDDAMVPLSNQVTSDRKADGRRKSADGRRKSLRKSSNFKPKSCEPTENSIKEEADFLVFSIKNKDLHEENVVQKDLSASNTSYSPEQMKGENQDSDVSSHLRGKQPQKSSVGRPLRRAVERVTSYKEISINVKMRRPE